MDHLLQTFLQASKGRSGDKLKAKTPDVYYGRSHMECYNFCQQYEDHFAICGATEPNRIPFVASFLRNWINFHWQQHKRKLIAESSVPISWDKFKVFFWKALGDSRAFVNNYWMKIRWDSQYQRRKSWTGRHTWSTYKLCWKSLTLPVSPTKQLWFAISEWDYVRPSEPSWIIKDKI